MICMLTYRKFERHDVPISAVLFVTRVRIQVMVRGKAAHPVIAHTFSVLNCFTFS